MGNINEHHSDLHEIEKCIGEHPEIENVLVVSVPNPGDDEVLVAFVIKNESSRLSAQELRQYCFSQSVTKNQVPKHIEFIDEYPMTPSGKVQKLKLIEKAKDLINENE